MGSDWREVSIESIAIRIAMGPFGSDIKTENFVSSGVPVIRGGNLTSGRFRGEDFVFLTEEKANELMNANAYPGDLVFTHRGTLGQVGLLPEKPYNRYVVSQSQMKLTCDKEQAISEYIYYYFKSPIGQNALLMNTSQTGVPAISRPVTSLKAIRLHLPPLLEQHAIAHILGTLDDKIELNQKMNETLEAMAQTLFKSWFVDFDPVRAKIDGRWKHGESLAGMPAHFYDLFPIDLISTENLGDVPKDWQVAKLGDIADVLNGFAFKSKDYSSSGIFVLRTKNFSDNGYAERLSDDVFLPPEFLTSHKSYLCEEFDFFLVMVGASIGKVSTIFSTCLPALRNQNMWCFRPKKDFSSRFYINHAVTRIIQLNSQIASGSARDFFRKDDFKKFYIIKPPVPVLESFEEQVSSLYRRISVNHREISDLVCLRDSLLPRLISGELRIKDAKKIIGDAS